MVNLYPETQVIIPVNPLYPSSAQDPIDLRYELHKILFGGDGESPKGHWVIYRRMDLTTHSQYWNEDTKEAVGGPAWEYEDELYRSRRTVGRSAGLISEMEQYTDVGIINEDYVSYYFEYDVNPKYPDEIYEIADEATAVRLTKPSVIQLPYRRRYKIREAFPFRCDQGGRIEYWICICRRDLVE